MLGGDLAHYLLYCVFAQELVSATASPGSAAADRKRDTDPAQGNATTREVGYSVGFALASAVSANRTVAATATT
jgi:hypothetical protein